MHRAECLTLPETRPRPPWPVSEMAGNPPLMPVAAGGLSGRPRCRIFPVGRLWVLQLETPSGWLMGEGPSEPPLRVKFRTLAAAVNHAVLMGYDYRIITPTPVARLQDHGRWPARSERQSPSRSAAWGRQDGAQA
jgi:hypothetical protein